jgi:hypothetical protein
MHSLSGYVVQEEIPYFIFFLGLLLGHRDEGVMCVLNVRNYNHSDTM